MPSFDLDTETKIATLRGLYNLGTTIEVCELVKVAWATDEIVYYATWDMTEQASVPPVDEDDNPITIEVRLQGDDSNPTWFLPVKMDSTVGDEEIDLELWDGDGDISDRLVTFGEGGQVTLYYWFPQVELLLRLWTGHLELGNGGDGITLKVKAAQGFRSSQENLPDRGHVQYCQAVFGGLLTTQDEIDQHDCPYNFHLGGPIGIANPDTSDPWTFCDRRDTQSCLDRGVYAVSDPTKLWYHFSHRTIEATIVNNQTKGPRLYETSHGNETNLSEPVPVVMGTRRKYGAPIIASRRDLNNRNPDEGFFQGEYEFCEGPIVSYSDTKISVGGGDPQPIVGFHYGERLGERGQAPVSESLTPHSYSGTAHIRYTSGPLNPESVDAGQATAQSLISGLRDIRVYYDAGNGLVLDYFRYTEFTERMGRKIVSQLNFPSNNTPPVQGQFSENGFGIKTPVGINEITFPFTETFTITTINDDKIKIWIDNVEDADTPIVDATYPSTGSGTFAATAGVRYKFRMDFTQRPDSLPNPWSLIVKWQSTSQALQVIPNAHFFHAATYTLEFSRNRVWHIARMLTDKRWGAGWDYNDLNIEMFQEAAEWVDKTVAYTDPFGLVLYHTRALSDVELVGRKEQQQIEDMCIAGRLSVPFMFDGKVCIVPLRALTTDELDAAPVFTEAYGNNIIWEGDPENSTLQIGPQKSAFELPNQIKVSIDDVTQDYLDTPLRPFEDVDAQLAAGRARGTQARKINKKEFKLLGVTVEAQATKLGWSLLDLGDLDRGGLANNLPIKFKIWFADALDLHPWKVIKVVSPRLTRYGFTYFRIMEMDRQNDLVYAITAQAYNETYMASFEDEIEVGDIPPDPPGPSPFPEPPAPQPLPCVLQFGTITMTDNVMNIPIEPC